MDLIGKNHHNLGLGITNTIQYNIRYDIQYNIRYKAHNIFPIPQSLQYLHQSTLTTLLVSSQPMPKAEEGYETPAVVSPLTELGTQQSRRKLSIAEQERVLLGAHRRGVGARVCPHHERLTRSLSQLTTIQ